MKEKMKILKYIVRGLFILLWIVLMIWNYVDGNMLKAIFWLLILWMDKEDLITMVKREVKLN